MGSLPFLRLSTEWHSTKKERNRDKERERERERERGAGSQLQIFDNETNGRREMLASLPREKRSSDRIDRLPMERKRGRLFKVAVPSRLNESQL